MKQLIDTYVSEVLPEILDYADKHNKVVLRAETGKEKQRHLLEIFTSTALTPDFLILAPLTITEQNEKDYKDKGGIF